jgi:hypothetical protein
MASVAQRQLYFDEREDVLTSTDLLAIVTPKLKKQPSYWKWMTIAAHNGLQGALVCAIQNTSATNVLNKESATKMLNYLKTLEGDRPQEYLADFVTLLKEYRKKYPSHGITPEQLKSIHGLHKQFRNNFAHFVPKGWWIEIAMFSHAGRASAVLIVLRSQGDQPNIVAHAAAARSSLSAPRATIRTASSANGLCSAFASSHGARIHTSRSSSVVRITGIALGRIGSVTRDWA